MNEIGREELEVFLKEVDNDFTPPLSKTINITEYTNKLIDNALIITNYCEGKLNGICAVYANDYSEFKAYLTMLAVHSDHRGKGVARELIRRAEVELVGMGFNSLVLEVYVNNDKALFLYKSCGFHVIDSFVDSVFMVKYL